MEGEFIIVAFISSMFGLIGLWMINQNWYKRQEIKYRYQIKRAKLSKKMSVPVKEEKTGFDAVKNLLPLLKGLDGDQIGELADRFLGEGVEESGGGGSVPEMLLEFAESNPEMVQSFLKGLGSKTDGTQDEPTTQV